MLLVADELARRQPAAELRASLGAAAAPLVVVAPGGGADGGRLIRCYLDALAEPVLGRFASFVVTGPLLDDAQRQEIEAIAARLGRVTVVPFTKDLVSYAVAADLVVTMGGANNLATLFALGKCVVSVPRARPTKEQLKRAERFAARPSDHDPPVRLDARPPTPRHPERLAAPPPVVDLDFGGVERVGDELEAALDRHVPRS